MSFTVFPGFSSRVDATIVGTPTVSISGTSTVSLSGTPNVKNNFLDTSLDPFGRLYTSIPFILFDSKMLKDVSALYWDDAVVSGSGTASTYNTNQSSVTISVSTNTAGHRLRQTKHYFNYQPGRGHTIMLTGILGVTTTGITSRLGYFDDENGLFFQSASGTISVVRRTFVTGSAVDTGIAQSSWNLDKLNGSGTSGITVDFSNTQIFIIDFQWLGTGRVRFGFNINGILYWCHQITNANSLTTVYMTNPNLPVRYSIQNNGTGVASSILQICCVVISENGNNFTGISRSIDRGLTSLVTANTDGLYYPLLAIRLNSSYKHSRVDISRIAILCTSTASYHWIISINPTIVGTALSFSQLTNSSIDYAIPTNATTITATTGTVVSSGYNTQGATAPALDLIAIGQVRLGSTYAGVFDYVTLSISRITGTTETFYAAMGIQEQY